MGIFDTLECNAAQAAAISHLQGAALVLAGPGSGKTFVIAQRIRYLLEEAQVEPEHLLVITFTKAAALEMQERAQKLLGAKALRISFGTFHSVFFNILRQEGRYSKGAVISEQDKFLLIKGLLNTINRETEDFNELIHSLLSDISRYKCAGFSESARKSFIPESFSAEDFISLYNQYTEQLALKRLLDFDDMLLMTYELLQKDETVRKKWQNRFTYIMIDEFQDIDALQYETVKLLLGDACNLFAVGDDDQSIYSFRGANPELMLNFEKDFSGARRIFLNMNYRSAPVILEQAKRLITNNKQRFDKDYTAVRKKAAQFEILDFAEREKEAESIILRIQQKAVKETAAILTRTNAEAQYFAEKLNEYNICFDMKESVRDIYTHFAAQDILAYLRLAQGKSEKSDMLRIMNRPVRYISREAVEEYFGRQECGNELLGKLIKDIAHLGKLRPYAAIVYILKGLGYEKYLREYAAAHHINFEELLEVTRELLDRASGHRTIDGYLAAIENYRSSMAELAKAQQKKEYTNNTVFIATLHGSKGLEYDTVFIVNIAEGIIPYKRAQTAAFIEEERRLLYVGMTRARDRLFLCTIQQYRDRKMKPSRFVEDLNGGDSLRHGGCII